MANTKRKNRRRRHVHRRRRNPSLRAKRRNTLFGGRRKHRHSFRRRRRNPASLGNAKELLTQAAYAIAGGMAARTFPQVVLGARNNGITGYAANIATAVAGGMLAGKFLGERAGQSVLLGGIVMAAGRVAEDYFGRRLVEFGAIPGVPSLSGDRLGSMFAGEYIDGNFLVPASSLPGGRPALPPPAPVAAASLSGAWKSAWN